MKVSAFWACLFVAGVMTSCSENKHVDTKATAGDEPLINTDVVANTTEMTFEKDSYDFGEVKQGDIVHTEFKFTNTGDHDLIITGARGSCGCTVPEWPKEPIAPGASNVIKVQFNSKNKNGPFNKTVTITANTMPSESKIVIKGTVAVPN